MQKIIFGIVGCLVVLIVFLVILFHSSPNPGIILLRSTLFRIPVDDRKKEYTEGNVSVFVDKEYPSKYKNNRFDLYTPKKPLENTPTIAWVHGGGFVGGDKLEEKEYATKLAELGYTVAVMNYELVPNTKYPRPVIQTSEFIACLSKNAEKYSINMDNLFIAGDSAGAQIASQFLVTQTNEAYRQLVAIDQVIEVKQVRGALLYCGLYNIEDLLNHPSSNLVKFIFGDIGWSYFKEKNWNQSTQADSSVISNYITGDFPPAYITDGNTASFEEQGKQLASELEAKQVPVTQRFFDVSEYRTAHEYQFKLETKPAEITFEDTVNFLEQYRIH